MEKMTTPDKPTMRFLSFANDKEDEEKAAKLKEAAAKIEQAMAKEKVLSELVDYKEEHPGEQQIDPTNDTRSLYERLQEQRNKKKEDTEESQKLSNWITTLDDDDVEYLNEVNKKKREDELRRRLEIQDALEAKKRLDEQKMLDEERRIKESLLGKSPHPSKTKSRLSSLIKMKPKVKSNEPDGQASTATTAKQENKPSDQTPPSSTASVSNSSHRQTDDKPQHDREISPTPKKAKCETDKDKQTENNKQNEASPKNDECTCPKNVMKSIGILPSLTIINKAHDSSDRDSDYSDDDLYGRLVPRCRSRRRHK